MTSCNRCGEDFSNFFQGSHWCPDCGKIFQFDANKIEL
jgi:transposase